MDTSLRMFRQVAFPNPEYPPSCPAQSAIHEPVTVRQNQFDKRRDSKYLPSPTETVETNVMKRCAYCGRENDDDAVHCRECGTTEFEGSASLTATTPGEPVVLRCDRCGATTNIAEGFFKEPKSFNTSTLTLCPACWQKHKASLYKNLLFFRLAIGLFGILFVYLWPKEIIGWVWLNIFIFDVALILSILPHELGHAFTAKWLGWRVFRIFIGHGRTVFKVKLLGFDTEFHILPFGGMVIEAPREIAHFHAKHFAIVVAGPLTNSILMAASFAAMGGSLAGFEAITRQLLPLQIFFIANLLIVMENLWPRQIATAFGKSPSDGKQLLEALKMDPGRALKRHAAGFIWESVLCQETKQFAEAQSWLERGLKMYPDDLTLLTSFGNNLLSLARFTEAREFFLKIVPRTDQDRFLHSILLNNIAYADALIGGRELLAEADQYSNEAMKNLSWMPSIKGTRGTVLSELGRLDEAIPLLQEATLTHEVGHNRAQNACLLAIAEARRGDLSAAQRYLEEARRQDSTCFLLERARIFLETKNSKNETGRIIPPRS
ncbi:MAG TPA: site-2 protease family protein, partial [Candidatus Acidoferrales bacterium]|nr:site-2 protease family protein [Candidatus Acidoferrales bacterium]